MELARGLRFSLPPKNVDGYDVKCSFELLFLDLKRFGPPLTTENQDRLKCQLKQITYGSMCTQNFSKENHILSKEEWGALTDLRKDDSITIARPDKGNKVVIINKLDYILVLISIANLNHFFFFLVLQRMYSYW